MDIFFFKDLKRCLNFSFSLEWLGEYFAIGYFSSCELFTLCPKEFLLTDYQFRLTCEANSSTSSIRSCYTFSESANVKFVCEKETVLKLIYTCQSFLEESTFFVILQDYLLTARNSRRIVVALCV